MLLTEPLYVWVIMYILDLLFWLWIIFWGGAERLERSFLASLISIFAVEWEAEQIKFFGWLMLIITTGIFIVGLLFPDMRLSRLL